MPFRHDRSGPERAPLHGSGDRRGRRPVADAALLAGPLAEAAGRIGVRDDALGRGRRETVPAHPLPGAATPERSTLGCVYALLAHRYALVHRIVGRFNLAVGNLSMWGARVTVVARA